MTAEQKNIAVAVRDELLLMFEDLMRSSRIVVALEGICDHYCLPKLDGALLPQVSAAVLAAEAAHAAYEELVAALSVQTGDAGAGASAPAPADPLRAAA